MSQPKRRIPLAMAMVYGSNPEFFKDQQIARLKRENQRLRKAGDALSYALQTCKYSAEEIEHYSDSWTKAKEGAP